MLNCFFFDFKLQVHEQKPNAYTMQPNVMKKSWTTSNIASAVEHDRRGYFGETQHFESRDLIREYLHKTRVPEILKPLQGRQTTATYSTSAMTSEMNIAYKHPLVIAEELKNGRTEALADNMLFKLGNHADNSSLIVPKAIKRQKCDDNSARPHLIGKVNPNIAKTWEQLSSAMDMSMESRAVDDDKQSYVLFVRKPYNFNASDDGKFAVNKIQHDDSEKFFDSIDNDMQYAEDYEDEEEESAPEGGEAMARELDSLELRCNEIILWSIES